MLVTFVVDVAPVTVGVVTSDTCEALMIGGVGEIVVWYSPLLAFGLYP